MAALLLVAADHLFLKVWPPEALHKVRPCTPASAPWGTFIVGLWCHTVSSISLSSQEEPRKKWGKWLHPRSSSFSVSVLNLCRKPSPKVRGHSWLSSGYFDYFGAKGQACAEKEFIQTFSLQKDCEPDHREAGQAHIVTILMVTLHHRQGAKHINLFVLKLFSEINAGPWKE